MPLSVFSLTVPSTSVPVDPASRRGTFTVDVKNESRADARAVVTVQGAAGDGTGPAEAAWFGESQQRRLAAGASEAVTVDVVVPGGVAAGSYGLVPVAYSADHDPAETTAIGPRMTLVLPPPVQGPLPWWRRWWPWWLVGAVVAVVVVVGAVALVRALTDDRVEIPEVEGRPAAAAEQLLTDLGLLVSRREEVALARPVGTALRTEPAAGTRVAPASSVVLVVARGPDVLVPSLVGTPPDFAQNALDLLGLRSRVTFDPPELRFLCSFSQCRVIDQAPAPSTSVPPGAVVELRVGL